MWWCVVGCGAMCRCGGMCRRVVVSSVVVCGGVWWCVVIVVVVCVGLWWYVVVCGGDAASAYTRSELPPENGRIANAIL